MLEEGLVAGVRRQLMGVLMGQYDENDRGRATQMARAINGVIDTSVDVPWVKARRGESGGEINDRAARTQSQVLRLAFLMDHLPSAASKSGQKVSWLRMAHVTIAARPPIKCVPLAMTHIEPFCEDCKAVNPYCTDCPAEPADD